jgi:hypothetical protein
LSYKGTDVSTLHRSPFSECLLYAFVVQNMSCFQCHNAHGERSSRVRAQPRSRPSFGVTQRGGGSTGARPQPWSMLSFIFAGPREWFHRHERVDTIAMFHSHPCPSEWRPRRHAGGHGWRGGLRRRRSSSFSYLPPTEFVKLPKT